MKNNERPLAISWGDPAGIGPEVILKAFRLLPKSIRNKMVVFGDLAHFTRLNRSIAAGVNILNAKTSPKSVDALRIEPIPPVKILKKDYGSIDKSFGQAAMNSLNAAAKAVADGTCSALVTAPIHKKSVNLAGYKIAGHTEYLAKMFACKNVAMMMANPKLKVVVATTHLPLRGVADALDKNMLIASLKLIHTSIKTMSGKPPRIAVCGLNPHAGDGGLFGDEERKIITPAINLVKRSKISVSGPYPADSLFTPHMMDKFDVALAMYHDQGLIPVKLLGFKQTVNITLGLPIIRVSVGHGAAMDIAGKNRADGANMAHAIKTAHHILTGKFR